MCGVLGELVEDDIDGVKQAWDVENEGEDDGEDECSADAFFEPDGERREEDGDDDEKEGVCVCVGHL